MDYKLYKIHHSRGKSDTNFYQEQNILNGAYSSLKVLRVSLVNELTYIPNNRKFRKSSKKKKKKKKKRKKQMKFKAKKFYY